MHFFAIILRKSGGGFMFYPLNRDLKRSFSEFFFLKIFCILYFVLYLLFILVFKLTFSWSMAISFAIIVFLMFLYIMYRKRKMKISLDHLWLSETERKIEKVRVVLEEHGFYSNNEKLFLLMDYYKGKIKSENHNDIFILLVILILTFLPIVIMSDTLDAFIVSQIISCSSILVMIYIGYIIFKKIWSSTITDIFNGQAYIKSVYEVLFYIYCRKLNDLSSDKKNLKDVANELKRSL